MFLSHIKLKYTQARQLRAETFCQIWVIYPDMIAIKAQKEKFERGERSIKGGCENG